MKTDLPQFKYHPDPLATGSIERSDEVCVCCDTARGYLYTGPVFAEDELHDAICPWCIASGQAHEQFDASFVDEAGIGDYGGWDSVPQAVIEEIAYRTPSFNGWQQEKWFTCCGDGAAFHGRAGFKELSTQWPDAMPAIQESSDISDDDWPELAESLDKDGSPTAYVFQCLHCARFGGYVDFD